MRSDVPRRGFDVIGIYKGECVHCVVDFACFFVVIEVVCCTHTHSTSYSSHVFITKLFREEAAAALRDGEEQLKILQRQAVVSQLYPSARSVME
jgi:hypothetical protein